jgi:putative transposase
VPHKRRDVAAGIFHVYTHSVWAAQALFRDDLDRSCFLRQLATVTRKIEWTCMAYCLMGSHHHLILNVADGVLPKGMHALNLAYARDFNRRHKMRGHVQFRRYGSKRIASDSQLLSAFRYVVRNPVDAGLCSAPQDWRWSSYAGTVRLAEPDSFVDASAIWSCFDEAQDVALARLRAFVEAP